MAANDDTHWKYIDLLNENIRILLTIFLGMVLGYFQVFDAATFVPQAVKFVFHVALPLLVIQGLGIGTDFYSDAFLWSYIGVFLIIRAVALVGSICFVMYKRRTGTHGIGMVAVYWLNLTWISTVILGIPIATAVFKNPTKGNFYGLLASISSFIFQLPLLLFFLECHELEKQMTGNRKEENDVEAIRYTEPGETEPPSKQNSEKAPSDNNEGQETAPSPAAPSEEEFSWLAVARDPQIWVKILIKVMWNPVLWAIAVGFIFSLSTFGPTYLKPLAGPGKPNPDFYEPLAWLYWTCEWFGACVSPVSLFAMGVWMQSQGKNLFQLTITESIIFMYLKLIIVPLLALGLAKGMNLGDEPGRAAVLIAALPITQASFSLGSKYKIGERMLAGNVALGTILLLPTILIWNWVLDKTDCFPITPMPPAAPAN